MREHIGIWPVRALRLFMPALSNTESDMRRGLQSTRGLAIAEVARSSDLTDASNQIVGPRHSVIRATLAFMFCFTVGTVYPAGAADLAANVDATRIVAADQDPANWMTYGRTYSEQRFSPLARITADNAKQLSLVWYADLDTNRGQEATPVPTANQIRTY